MDPITIAMALAQFAPSIVKWITGSDKAEAVATKAIDIAKEVTGAATGDQALDALKASPDLALKYRQAVLDQEVEFQKLAVQNAADVNATMRAEAAAEHWPTYSWRPSIGFAFAFNLVMSSVLVLAVYAAQVFGAAGADKAISALPGTLGALAAISGLATPILGIASWYRGKMQADPAIPTTNRG